MKKRLNLILEFLNPKDIKPYKCFLQPYSSPLFTTLAL